MMEPITYNAADQHLEIAFHGRIDSRNAVMAGEQIDRALEASDASETVLDFNNLEYISSAGLRLILKVRKLRPRARVVGVSPEVFDVLEMTGFTEMLPVEKAYRNVSLEGCELIGKGANGAVYRLNQDTIIKVPMDKNALPSIHRERELARRAFILGIPTAISYDVVRVGDTYGSVFELLDCKSMSRLLADNPSKIDEYAEIFVRLLKTIHSVEGAPGEMPSEKATVLGWVDFLEPYLPPSVWKKLRQLVEEIPQNNHLIHGDYHAKNIMIQNGEPLLIDMDTLCQGDPVFEFASIFNAYKGFAILDENVIKNFQGISRATAEAFLRKTLKLYFNTEDEAELDEIESKAALIGYTRLLRRSIRREDSSDAEIARKQEFYKTEICRLTEKLDRLTF